jgi:hypothetical protein
MASPWLKGMSAAVVALLTSASILSLPQGSAQAASPTSDSACLFIDGNDDLISAEYCTGNLVIPARVKTVKRQAFLMFSGSVSFEPNSQLETVERLAFHGGRSIKSIVFPPSVTTVAEFAIVDTGNTLIYIEGNASAFHQNAIWQISGNATFIQARSANRLTQTWTTLTYAPPFQIDCSALVGDRDFVGVTYLALELHNCRPPTKPDAVNPPVTAGHILIAGLNDSVAISSLDGSRTAVVRLRALGQSSMRFAATAEVSVAGFSIAAFGDDFGLPADNSLTCSRGSGSSLPTGVSLTSACRFEASTGSVINSTTDVVIDWVSNPGVSNSFDVAANGASALRDFVVSGSTSVRVNLQKIDELTAMQTHQMNVSTAKFSGATRDWRRAIDSYAALPSGQATALTAEPGLVADTAVDAYEVGQGSKAAASSAVNSFAASLTGDSSFLGELRSRIEFQAATIAVGDFETSGLRSQAVRQQILALPSSLAKTSLLARFTSATNSRLQQRASITAGVRTVVFSNPYLVEQFTVPAGVSQLNIELQGAEGSQGGDDRSGRPDRAGFKGLVSGALAVTPGQVIYLGVGEAGGDVSPDCVPGKQTIGGDTLVAKGGINPFGEFGGGDGGSPGADSCVYSSDSGGGYGGAGGAATVVRVGSPARSASSATFVAGGSAGSGGSVLAGDRSAGAIGLSNFVARGDWDSSNGQSGQAFNYYAVRDELVGTYEPFITGSAGGGGGGATGGIRGDWAYSAFGGCPTISFCFAGSSPGSNSTAGLSGVASSYVRYTFDSGFQANGRVSISYVVPAASQPTNSSTDNGSSDGTDPVDHSVKAPDAPQKVKAVAFWKSAEVSWQAPADDGNSPINLYEVKTKSGQTCTSTQLSCRITGLAPGQLLELSVRAQNGFAFGPAAGLSGGKVLIPLSINLWQVRQIKNLPMPKFLNPAQLRALRAMLSQDTGGFILTLRLAKNSSKLSGAKMQSLLDAETAAIKAQLRSAGLLAKVRIETRFISGNPKAFRPSVILLSTKP